MAEQESPRGLVAGPSLGDAAATFTQLLSSLRVHTVPHQQLDKQHSKPGPRFLYRGTMDMKSHQLFLDVEQGTGKQEPHYYFGCILFYIKHPNSITSPT